MKKAAVLRRFSHSSANANVSRGRTSAAKARSDVNLGGARGIATATLATTAHPSLSIDGRSQRQSIQVVPTRSYMAGLTRSSLRSTASATPTPQIRTKSHSAPSEAAYEPHTVFILESRFPINNELGTVDHVIGVCRAGDLPDLLKDYNSDTAPHDSKHAMDNARWPWQDPTNKSIRKARWWTSKSEWVDAMKATTELSNEEIEELYTKAKINATELDNELIEEGETEELDAWRHGRLEARKKENAEPTAKPSEQTSAPAGPRTPPSAHSTGSLLSTSQGDHGYYSTDKRQLDKQREAVAKSLKEHSGGAPIEMIRPTNKIPFEVESKDGLYLHPSGFVPPTPAHHFSDDGPTPQPSQPAIEPASRTESYSEASINHEHWKDIKDANQHLMMGGNVSASTISREQKIPTEVVHEGDAIHASGFIPPTPRMHRGDSEAFVNDIASLEQEETIRKRSQSPAPFDKQGAKVENPKKGEVMPDLKSSILAGHVSATTESRNGKRPVEVTTDDGPAHASGYVPPAASFGEDQVETPSDVLTALREKYSTYIEERPFYRPLLTFTLSTRPLALSMARLLRSLAHNKAYETEMSLDDKASKLTPSTRSRALRIARSEELAVSLAQALKGDRGDLAGIRFSAKEPGRKAGEEISLDKRVIQIGVGSWYSRAEEVKEDFAALAQEAVGDKTAFEIFDVSHRGRRFSDGKDVKWPEPVHELESLPFLTEIERIQKFLLGTRGNSDQYSVIYPGDLFTSEDGVKADPYGEKIRIVRRSGDAEVKDGEKVVSGPVAKMILRQRLEQLTEHNATELVRRMAMRHTSVEYPSQST